MPGPVSDSYDPEFGTGENASRIREALGEVYERVSVVLGKRKPLYVLRLVDSSLPKRITATLSEKEWHLIRFALERATESI